MLYDVIFFLSRVKSLIYFCSPVNLIDAYEESWMFACAFAIMTTSVLDLFTGNFYYNPDVSGLPSTLQGKRTHNI